MPISLIVVDANVIVAALLKSADTRRILLSEKAPKMIAPEYILAEIEKYAPEYAERLQSTEKEISNIVNAIFSAAKIKILPKNEYDDWMEKATKISPDPKDAPYFALALKFDCAIWSSDKTIRKQSTIPILNTEQLARNQMEKPHA